MKTLMKFLMIFAILLVISSCKSDDDDGIVDGPPVSTMVTFKAVLSGANEVPSNTSLATGNATLTFNKETKIFSMIVSYNDLIPVGGHIHQAPSGENGPVIFPLGSELASPLNYTSSVLTSVQEDALNAGLYYVNLHTEAFPSGEIRGQLIKQ